MATSDVTVNEQQATIDNLLFGERLYFKKYWDAIHAMRDGGELPPWLLAAHPEIGTFEDYGTRNRTTYLVDCAVDGNWVSKKYDVGSRDGVFYLYLAATGSIVFEGSPLMLAQDVKNVLHELTPFQLGLFVQALNERTQASRLRESILSRLGGRSGKGARPSGRSPVTRMRGRRKSDRPRSHHWKTPSITSWGAK